MKISLALLILLLAAAWTGSQGFFHSSTSNCCPKSQHMKIPESKIQGYKNISSNCKFQAVLLKVPRGWVCVNSQEDWVQDYLKKQTKSKSTST